MTDLTTEDLASLDREATQGETRTIECATMEAPSPRP